MRVLLAGGGTAGHVNPLLALAAELRDRDPATDMLVLGTAQGLEARLVPAAGLELAEVPKAPLPRSLSQDWLKFSGRFRAALRAAEHAIDRLQADVVVGFGGYVATPAYLAAKSRSVASIVHEANWRPGLANRWGARSAARVAITFPGTPLRGGILTGLPMRRAIASLDRERARVPARRVLGLDEERTTLLVTGGSLGAQRLNETAIAAAEAVLATGAQVLHLTGSDKAGAVRAGLASLSDASRYHVREYLAEMDLAYAAADLVVCRSGAGTVCELSAVGLPAIYVPLPIGNGEQALNCRGVVDAGGGLMRENASFTPEWATEHIPPLLDDQQRLTAMGQAAASVGIRDGAARLAALVEEVVRERNR